MTGKHLGHAEIRGNRQAKTLLPQFDEGQYPLSPDAVTVAQLFQRAGYATGAMGKWGLGPVNSDGEPNKKGFDLFFGYNCQGVAHSYYPAHVWRNREKVFINPQPIPGHKKQPEGEVKQEAWIGQTYAPKLMVAEAVKFIDANQSRPFFLYLPFIEPHVAMHPPKESVDRFPLDWDSEVYRGQCGYLPNARPRASYAAMISDLDSYVGQVVAALEKTGVADRTLVVFTSDNGTTHPGQTNTHFHIGGADPKFFNSTADLRGYKGSLYEGGIRVPMIVRLPGQIRAGAVADTPGYFADWMPTLCEAAGLEQPSSADGQSLWNTMTGQTTTNSDRKPMVWVFPEYGGQVAVRIGDHKVIRQRLNSANPGPWEVYDLRRDQAESHDLSAVRPDLIRQAIEILRRETSANKIFPVPIPELLES